MGHLSRERLLALAETPAPDDNPHLAACARCREEVRRLREVLADLRGVDVPEPAPLFWEYLSDRIRGAVRHEAAPARRLQAWRPWLAWAAPLAAAIVLAIGTLLMDPPPRGSAGEWSRSTGVAAGPVTEDDDWQFLLAILAGEGDGAAVDLLAAPAPGDAEPLVASLSSDEQDALVRLLKRELEGK